MTDKQFIETLKNIQKYCSLTVCSHCRLSIYKDFKRVKFSTTEKNYETPCALRNMIIELDRCPESWDIEKIERILGEEYD